MTYALVNLPFLAVALVVLIAAVVARRGPRAVALAGATLVVIVLTAVFDNVLVGVGIVGYDPTRISGIRIGVAPIEDFAYALAGLLLLPALWELLAPRRREGADA